MVLGSTLPSLHTFMPFGLDQMSYQVSELGVEMAKVRIQSGDSLILENSHLGALNIEVIN